MCHFGYSRVCVLACVYLDSAVSPCVRVALCPLGATMTCAQLIQPQIAFTRFLPANIWLGIGPGLIVFVRRCPKVDQARTDIKLEIYVWEG